MVSNTDLFKIKAGEIMKKFIVIMTGLLLGACVFAQSKWFKAQSNSATVKSVTATSELVEAQFDGKYLYPPINILDGDFNSTWCEADQKGSGIGESITVEFAEPVSFDEIQIVNGFVTKDYYLKNNRVKTIRLTQVAKEHFQQKDYTLKDNVQDWQSIKFDLLQTAQTLTIEIREVYRGAKYDDTCLDDIRLLYKGNVIPFENVANLKAVQIENSRQMLHSNAKEFEKQFLSLAKSIRHRFGGLSDSKYIFLKSEKKHDDRVIKFTSERNNKIDYIADCMILSQEEFLKEKKLQLNDDYYWYRYNSNIGDPKEDPMEDDFDYSKYQYYIGYWEPYFGYGYRVRYEFGNSRIITSRQVDYVEVKTVTLIKIDGNSIFIDGVKYTVIDPDKALDVRFYDGP